MKDTGLPDVTAWENLDTRSTGHGPQEKMPLRLSYMGTDAGCRCAQNYPVNTAARTFIPMAQSHPVLSFPKTEVIFA